MLKLTTLLGFVLGMLLCVSQLPAEEDLRIEPAEQPSHALCGYFGKRRECRHGKSYCPSCCPPATVYPGCLPGFTDPLAAPGEPQPSAPDAQGPLAPQPDSGPMRPLDTDALDSQFPSVTDDAADPGLDDFPTTPPSATSQMAQSFGAPYGGSGVPDVIGDFFGGSLLFDPASAFFDTGMGSAFPNAAINLSQSGADRRRKISEQHSALPRDRVFFSFNDFHNAVNDVNQVAQDIDRFQFGFEKTFFHGLTSFELRIPWASGLNSVQTIGQNTTRNAEFGDISSTIKLLLTRNRRHAFAIGMTSIWATGDDAIINDAFGSQRLRVENEAIHLAPYMALLLTPNSKWFHQFYLQFDFDTSGNALTLESVGSPGPSEQTIIQDPTLMFVDYSVGRWILQRSHGLVRGVAPMFEIHYTTTLQDIDQSTIPSVQFLNDRRDLLNLSSGVHFQIGKHSTFRIAAAAPVRTGVDKTFDAEIACNSRGSLGQPTWRTCCCRRVGG